MEEQLLNSNQNGHRLKAVVHLIVVPVFFSRNLHIRKQIPVDDITGRYYRYSLRLNFSYFIASETRYDPNLGYDIFFTPITPSTQRQQPRYEISSIYVALINRIFQ